MRTGVILLTSSASKEADRLDANLRAKGISVLQFSQDDVDEAPETITDFIADNRLETLVVSNISRVPPPECLRQAIEEAGLGRLAVGWIDLVPLLGEQPSEGNANVAHMMTLANAARLQHADYARSAVLRTLPSSSKISRRELFGSIPRVLRVESDIPIVLADRCGRRSKSCNYCIRTCPVDAVSAAAEAVTINDRLCIECGACARDCPVGAIQSPSISDAQIIAMLDTLASEELGPNKRALMLTCSIGFERLLDEGRKGRHLCAGIVPVQIPCVSSIGSVHYLWSASLGVTLVTLCPDMSCKRAVAMFPLYRHAESSKNIVKALREDKATSVHHLALHANDSVVDFISREVVLASPVNSPMKLSGVARREVMVDAIRALRTNSGEGIELSEDSTLPLFELTVDDVRCTFCELCQRDCPDHAIEFTKNEDTVALMFDPSLCGGCMICEKNCPERAITLSRLRGLSPILEQKRVAMARDETAKCEKCGAILGPKRSLMSLKKKLSEQGVSDAALRTLGQCIGCRQRALIE